MSKIINFLKYNNAMPVAISLILLGAGGAMAATNPEAVFSSVEKVISIDNTYIASKDLSVFTPQVEIVAVTEDAKDYHVSFKFMTIDLEGSKWRDVVKDQQMNVSKAELGQYGDLGLYVTKQLKQIVDRELSYLSEVQEKARKNVTLETVATVYSGLIGKFLDTKTETLPGYTPVVTPPVPPPAPPTPIAPPAEITEVPPQNSPPPDLPLPNPTPPAAPPSEGGNNNGSDITPPTIQILGANPVEVPLGETYVDLGAVVTDNVNQNLSYEIRLNGQLVSVVNIDTSTTSTYTIEYSSTDQAGNSANASRAVIISPANPPAATPYPDPVPATPDPAPIPDSSSIETPIEEDLSVVAPANGETSTEVTDTVNPTQPAPESPNISADASDNP